MAQNDLLLRAKEIADHCSCGKKHTLDTKEVYAGRDLSSALKAQVLELAKDEEVLVIFDERTKAVAGEKVMRGLEGICRPNVLVLQGDDLHADASTIGDVFLHVNDETKLLVAVGSGTINDSTRMISYRLGIPYLIVGTAPSMDGFAASVSPVIKDGMKLTVEACSPVAVILDEDVLSTAPNKMVAAGLGDMLGKHIAFFDWYLSKALTGEYLCEEILQLMADATEICEQSAEGLYNKEPEAVSQLARGLTLSGLAMQLMGNSRPASSSEHHIAHFVEMMQLQAGQKPTLHGDKVGVGTLLMLDFLHLLFAKKRELKPFDIAEYEKKVRKACRNLTDEFLSISPLDREEEVPVEEQYRRFMEGFDGFKEKAEALYQRKGAFTQMLQKCGGPVRYEELGMTKAQIKENMISSFLLRTRYGSLRMCYYFGWLEDIVDEMFA